MATILVGRGEVSERRKRIVRAALGKPATVHPMRSTRDHTHAATKRGSMASAAARCAALGLLLLVPATADAGDGSPPPAAMSADQRGALLGSLMGKVDAMNRSSQGIFYEDVTPLAAPYFPPGQPMTETAAILHEQRLGDLRPYVGKSKPEDGTMYAARFELMSHVFVSLYVVMHFFYTRAPDGSLALDHMHAHLRSMTM